MFFKFNCACFLLIHLFKIRFVTTKSHQVKLITFGIAEFIMLND